MEPCSLLLPYRFLTVRAFDTACHEYSSFLPFTTLFVHLQAGLLSLTVSICTVNVHVMLFHVEQGSLRLPMYEVRFGKFARVARRGENRLATAGRFPRAGGLPNLRIVIVNGIGIDKRPCVVYKNRHYDDITGTDSKEAVRCLARRTGRGFAGTIPCYGDSQPRPAIWGLPEQRGHDSCKSHTKESA